MRIGHSKTVPVTIKIDVGPGKGIQSARSKFAGVIHYPTTNG
jgi:hypothetical protein